MAATNRYRNVSGCGFTPTSGSLVSITGIKSANYDEGVETLMESADADAFHTVGGVIMSSPKVTIDTIDAGVLSSTVAGTKGTLVYTLRDFTNGATASGGAKLFTLSNAFLGTRTNQAQYNQLATQNLVFMSTSTDGSTHPMAISAV